MLPANALESDNAQDPMGLTRKQLQADQDQTTPEAIEFNTRKSTQQGTLGADLRSDLQFAQLEVFDGWDRSARHPPVPVDSSLQRRLPLPVPAA